MVNKLIYYMEGVIVAVTSGNSLTPIYPAVKTKGHESFEQRDIVGDGILQVTMGGTNRRWLGAFSKNRDLDVIRGV